MSAAQEDEIIPLSDEERTTLIAQLEKDGYVIIPRELPHEFIQRAIAAIDRISAPIKAKNPSSKSVKVMNCVGQDVVFQQLMMYEPALQLCYDVFGPTFQLCQSNFISRPKENTPKEDFLAASPWHADGPRPKLFPQVNGGMGLHYLKFGYFLTDLTHGNGGPLQVVRGSHKKLELDGIPHSKFNINDFEKDLVTLNVKAGTIVAFHQAQWHAAPPNHSDIERKNVYISYCPTWMKPLDREYPTAESLTGLTPETKWLLGEPRPPVQWWLPSEADLQRMDKYKRRVDQGKATKTVYYD